MKPITALLALGLASVQGLVLAQERPASPIRYGTVAQAYDGVRANQREEILKGQDGWITIIVKAGPDEGIWSFTPRSSPAFPAVVRRQITEQDGRAVISLAILCESGKQACDTLADEFKQVNQKMAADLNQGKGR